MTIHLRHVEIRQKTVTSSGDCLYEVLKDKFTQIIIFSLRCCSADQMLVRFFFHSETASRHSPQQLKQVRTMWIKPDELYGDILGFLLHLRQLFWRMLQRPEMFSGWRNFTWLSISIRLIFFFFFLGGELILRWKFIHPVIHPILCVWAKVADCPTDVPGVNAARMAKNMETTNLMTHWEIHSSDEPHLSV